MALILASRHARFNAIISAVVFLTACQSNSSVQYEHTLDCWLAASSAVNASVSMGDNNAPVSDFEKARDQWRDRAMTAGSAFGKSDVDVRKDMQSRSEALLGRLAIAMNSKDQESMRNEISGQLKKAAKCAVEL